jgi:hypothetical protein
MGWFKKKREIVDLTDMQKRGLLPENASSNSEISMDEEGVVDFSSNSSSVGTGASSEDTSGFGFLSGLAGAGNVEESSSVANVSSTEDVGRYTQRLRKARASASNLDHLQTKIEDVEYKLDRFLERLEKIEDKLG